MEVRSGRHRRQRVDVVGLALRELVLTPRDEQHTVETQRRRVLQDQSDAVRAVALAGEKARRSLPAVGAQPVPDRPPHGDGVAPAVVPRLRVDAGQRAAEAGRYRIDEDEVEGIDRAVGIVGEVGGAPVAGARGDAPHRAERAHVQRRRRGARAAVEEEHDRPPHRVRDSIARVGDRHHRGTRAAIERRDDVVGHRRGVRDALAADRDLVVRDRAAGRLRGHAVRGERSARLAPRRWRERARESRQCKSGEQFTH